MERPVSVLLVGIGGYGAKYVEHLLREGKDRNVFKDFPEELKRVEGTPPLVWMEGLSEIMKKAYETEKLFSEMGVGWAEAGNRIDVRDYKEFKGCSL